ncbi:MAG: Gfo/Idh/MocA family oxidoreductase [Ferruginibacter sp.]
MNPAEVFQLSFSGSQSAAADRTLVHFINEEQNTRSLIYPLPSTLIIVAMNKKNNSRRNFIKNATIATAGFYIVPRHVLGRGYIAPSDKLNIAGIGAGGKAEVNLPYAWNNGAENIVALCDVDDRMAVKARAQWPKAPYYKDYRKLLDKEHKNIDAVIITTPDHMHAPMALAAMQLGKHVYCEKPLTHDIYEARILTEAAAKYKVVTQMGNQGSSGDDTRNVETWIQSGVI